MNRFAINGRGGSRMRKAGQKGRRIQTCVLALLIFLSAVVLCPMQAEAAESEQLKTVRISMDDSDIFIRKDASGNPIGGYAYEYIQSIAAYAGWKVEYFPCGGFAECFQAVADGKTDLVYDISYTEERTKQMLFPDEPMGSEDYYLYCLTENDEIRSDDLKSLNGKKVGITKGIHQIDALTQWCEANGIEPEFVEFDSIPLKENALEAGQIDINYEVSMLAKSNYSALSRIGGDDYYLTANIEREDLIADINEAIRTIKEVNPFYLENLTQKYFAKSILNRTLSSEERAWVDSHDTLRVGYLDDYMPFSEQDENGEADGIVKDIVPLLLSNIEIGEQLSVEYIAYADSAEMFAALAEGRIDTVFPVYDNIEFGIRNNISVSSHVINLSADFVYYHTYSEETVATIAVNRNNQYQEYYTRSCFPQAEIVYFDTIDDALRAVAEQRVGSTILNGMRTSLLMAGKEYESIATVRLSQPFGFSFAVSEGNSALLSILNRSIISMDNDFALNFVFDYLSMQESSPFVSFIQKNKVALMIALAVMLVLIVLAAIITTVTFHKNRRQIAQQSAFTRYFFEPYISAYYVGLRDHSWQIYKRIDKLAENYTTLDNFQESIRKYIDRDVHPDDRETVSVLLKPETLREKLAQQTSFGFTFRQRVGSEIKYLRCEMTRGADEDHMAIAFKDISDDVHKQQEEKQTADLADQQRHIKVFGDMINAAIWSMNIDDGNNVIAVRWSPEFRRMFGFEETEEDFPNTVEAWSSRLHPEDKEKALEDFQRSIESRNTQDFVYDIDYRILRKNGEYRWYHAVGRMENVDDGTRRMYGIIYDISADKRLKEQQIELQTALDTVKLEAQRTDAVIEMQNAVKWSYEINQDGNLTGVEYDRKRLFSFVKSGIGPLDWLASVHPEDRERAYNDIMETIHDQSGNTHSGSTFRLMEKDGKYRWMKSVGRVFRRNDGTAEFFGMSMDITEQMEEQEKRTAEKNEMEKLRTKELELRHSEFRASALAHLAESEEDITAFLNFYAGRLRELVNSDQVIFMDAEGNRFFNNSPELGADFEINEEYCQNCPHYDMRSSLYTEGVTEMPDTSVGWKGVPVHTGCPVKSSLTRTVQLNGRVCGYLAIHYILDYHEFSDYERQTLEEFANLLSMSLARYDAKIKNNLLEQELEQKRAAEYEALSQNYARIFALEDNFESIYDIELENGHYEVFADGGVYRNFGWDRLVRTTDFFEDLHKNAAALICPEDTEGLFAILNRDSIRRELENQSYFEYYYRRIIDDRIAWFKIRIVYKDAEKKNVIVGVFNAENDIEAKQIVEQKEQLEKQQGQLEEALVMAQSANRAKTRFLFNMSHDIRTPMNAILGFTDMAKKCSDDPKKLDDSLNKIQEAGKLLLSLINNVLEMSRIESGKAELKEEPSTILNSFRNVDSVMQELAKEKDIDLSFEFVDIRDDKIYCDYDRTNRIFVNIISNAIKYTNNGGWVKVKCEQLGRQDEEHGLYRYTFEDNGIGMSEEFQKHLFDEFTRENNTTSSGVQGSGLGLSLVKSFVELMHGTIDYRSKQGEGTTFIVTMPLRLQKETECAQETAPLTQQTADVPAQEEAKAEPVLEGRRILLVEDNEMNREIAVFILEEANMVVEEAEDGTAAVQKLREKGADYYDAILMDIQMPVMNGYEATKAIREMYPDDRLPIIALSANAFAEDKAASIAAGMNDHIAKPINNEELFRVLSKLL